MIEKMKHFSLVSAICIDVGARFEESGGEQRTGEQSRGEEENTLDQTRAEESRGERMQTLVQ